MGILRLLLAMSVVNGHYLLVKSPLLINAGVAVMVFFVISGFYMAMVINEKYAHLTMWRARFFLNRALRLLPVYFFILFSFAFFQAALTGSNYLTWYPATIRGPEGLLVLLNFTIVGQDIFMWLRETGVISSQNPVLIQPAWSIASEIVFYIVAAFTFRGARGIILTTIAAIAVCWMLRKLNGVPSRLPMETFHYFALGGVSYLIFKAAKPMLARIGTPLIVAPVFVIVCAFCYYSEFSSGVLYLQLVIALCIPALFVTTEASKIDSFLGDLSYPLYLVHIPTYNVLQMVTPEPSFWLAALVSALLSVLLVLLIDGPIQRNFRSRVSSPSEKLGVKFALKPE